MRHNSSSTSNNVGGTHTCCTLLRSTMQFLPAHCPSENYSLSKKTAKQAINSALHGCRIQFILTMSCSQHCATDLSTQKVSWSMPVSSTSCPNRTFWNSRPLHS